MYLRIRPQDIPQTIGHIERVYKKFNPGVPFDYSFFDEAYDRIYRTEQRLGTIFRYFAALAVIISCLGIFGLAASRAEMRTKEIGIRKVLGATVPGIVYDLSKEFAIWVLVANALAWPVAYFAMNKWVQSFAYRTSISLWIFVFSATLALVIALITVSFQSIKVALANPVDSLRYE
jgi:putative ABC transport system permease protein